jgi:F-type H+-transporting ATPase subunit b
MHRILLALLIVVSPALLAQTGTTAPADSAGGGAARSDRAVPGIAAHGTETHTGEGALAAEAGHEGGEGHAEKTYFGIPGWILKLLNMILFFGVLGYFISGPMKTVFAGRSAAIRRAADEARERREKSDQMAGQIRARLAAIEADVQAIHARAEAEGERQKRELMIAAEAEAEKILQAARNEVDNRLKHARAELTEFAGRLAAERAEQILREKMTDQDQTNLFQESLREVGEVRS